MTLSTSARHIGHCFMSRLRIKINQEGRRRKEEKGRQGREVMEGREARRDSKKKRVSESTIMILAPQSKHIAMWPQGTNTVLISFSKQTWNCTIRKDIHL